MATSQQLVEVGDVAEGFYLWIVIAAHPHSWRFEVAVMRHYINFRVRHLEIFNGQKT